MVMHDLAGDFRPAIGSRSITGSNALVARVYRALAKQPAVGGGKAAPVRKAECRSHVADQGVFRSDLQGPARPVQPFQPQKRFGAKARHRCDGFLGLPLGQMRFHPGRTPRAVVHPELRWRSYRAAPWHSKGQAGGDRGKQGLADDVHIRSPLPCGQVKGRADVTAQAGGKVRGVMQTGACAVDRTKPVADHRGKRRMGQQGVTPDRKCSHPAPDRTAQGKRAAWWQDQQVVRAKLLPVGDKPGPIRQGDAKGVAICRPTDVLQQCLVTDFDMQCDIRAEDA